MKKIGSLKAWLYLLPAILFLGVFMVYPLFDVFVYSFEEGYNSASQTYFGTGLYNYSARPVFFAGRKKHIYSGYYYGAPVHGPCASDFRGAYFHQAAPQPVPDHLFPALCDQYPGSGAGVYDFI